MDIEKKKRLDSLKCQHKEKVHQSQIASEIKRIAMEVSSFEENYRLASKPEKISIAAFLKNLPSINSTTPDFSKLSGVETIDNAAKLLTIQNNAWCCFLCGSAELFDINPYGHIRQFAMNLEEWLFICPYILLLFDNMNDFIYVDDYGRVTKAKRSAK